MARRKNFRKKRFRRRRRRRGGSQKMTIRRSPMAQKFKTHLRYTDQINLNPGVLGIRAVHVFRANSLFDPDETGAGHQPRGFDQIMPMYEKYTVIGCQIKATFMANEANQNARVCVAVVNTGSPLVSFNDYLESGTANTKFLTNTSQPSVTVMKNVSMSKWFSKSHLLSEDTVQGGLTSNPGEVCHFHVVVAGVNQQDTGNVTVQIEIQYITIFTEPVVVGQS